jgi:hypothetical protein
VQETQYSFQLVEGYRNLLPPFSVYNPKTGTVQMRVIELTSPNKQQRVVFCPMGVCGTIEHFEAVGAVARGCKYLMIEGVGPLKIHRLPPAYFMPPKVSNFPTLGVEHRYYDIFDKEGKQEPPLLAAGAELAGRSWSILIGMVPPTARLLYLPHYLEPYFHQEAKHGWGRLKALLLDPDVTSVAVPWSTQQINNLACSLVRLGWTVSDTSLVPYMKADHIGQHFVNYFNYPATKESAASVTE